MKAFYAEEQKRHDPKAFLSSGAPQPNPEQPERVERLLAGAKAAGCSVERPQGFGLGPIAAVHTAHRRNASVMPLLVFRLEYSSVVSQTDPVHTPCAPSASDAAT